LGTRAHCNLLIIMFIKNGTFLDYPCVQDLNPTFMDKERLFYLLQQYLADNATPEEKEELFAYIKLPESEETLRCVIEELWKPDKTL
jgi:hypothetical protein